MSSPKSAKYVHSAADLPAGEHWAIISGESVTIPGDERSRTAPGHGYPEHTDHYVTYRAFTDEKEFREELEKEFRSQQQNRWATREVRGIHVSEVYSADVVVAIKGSG